MKKFYFVLISLCLFSQNALASDTLQSLKNRENEILNNLKNVSSKDTKQNPLVKQEKLKENGEIIYTTNYKKRKLIQRKLYNTSKEKNKNTETSYTNLSVNDNISELSKNIQKANELLKNSKEDRPQKTIKKQIYTISYDYFDEIAPTDSFVYVTNDVSLHTLPSLSSKLIYLVRANTKLRLDKNHGAWYRVKSADNKYGWILGDLLYFGTPNEESMLRIRGKGF